MKENTVKMNSEEKLAVNWNLDDVYKLDEYSNLISEVKTKVDDFSGKIKQLNPQISEQDFVNLLAELDLISELCYKLGARPLLSESVDQKDAVALKMKNQLKDIDVEINEKLQPFYQWLKGKEIDGLRMLDDENAKRLFAVAGDKKYTLEYSRKMGVHSLGVKEETIISAKDSNGVNVVNDLRDVIETEFEFDFKPKGGKAQKIKTLSEITALAYSPDENVRDAAYCARFEQYSNNIDKFFLIYQAIVKDWNYGAKLRGYKSAIGVRNALNHVSDKSIEVLMDVCGKNLEVFQRYFRFKAKALGKEKLTRFDLYAPLEVVEQEISYLAAVEMVLDAYNGFSDEFAKRAELILKQQHVDSHPDENKRGGAYCMTITPKITPYVFLNFTGKSRDVSTLAHELGHGIHSLFANNLSVSVQHPNLPLAETASTFGEMVLFEKLLESSNDVAYKRSLLSDKMSDMYAGIIRQNFFVKFEIEAHEKLQAGITEKDLSQIWLGSLYEQFGESVEVDEMFRHEWAYIPHIHHTPFYCYAYNFGELLSMSLYKRYKEEGDSFIPKIEKILSAGGSEDPAKILAEVGIDMESAEFWQSGFALIEGWMKQLEQL